MASAASVMGSTVPDQGTRPGSTPRAALQTSSAFGPKELVLRPVPAKVAKDLCRQHHYLHSYPGGSQLNFGIFVGDLLLGIVVIGVGGANIHTYFYGADPRQVACLTRLWLDDRLGRNCESRVLAVVLRLLRKHQDTIKSIIAYSDPLAGHTGAIYRAAGYLYVGPSSNTPLYRLPDGSLHHSRSLSHVYGTHSLRHFERHGMKVELVEQVSKHTYVALVDRTWRGRLQVPVLPYPQVEEQEHGDT